MDISFWTALHPSIQLLDTNRLLHGKYLYRLAVRAPGCSLLRSNGDLDQLAENRNAQTKNYNYGGSWNAPSRSLVLPKDVVMLKRIRNCANQLIEGSRGGIESFKMRLEEPTVQFYTSNEHELKLIAQSLSNSKDNTHLESIMMPRDDFSRSLLLDGYVLRKKPIEWTHRIMMRDGRYSMDTKTQLKNYLINLGDSIKVPKNLWSHLDKGGWIWGGYIYVKDPTLATVLGMIDTNLIAKIEEFKTMPSDEINTTIIQES
jgi:hypothetical protein